MPIEEDLSDIALTIQTIRDTMMNVEHKDEKMQMQLYCAALQGCLSNPNIETEDAPTQAILALDSFADLKVKMDKLQELLEQNDKPESDLPDGVLNSASIPYAPNRKSP